MNPDPAPTVQSQSVHAPGSGYISAPFGVEEPPTEVLEPEGGPHPFANGRQGIADPAKGTVPVGTLVQDVETALPAIERSGLLAKLDVKPVATILTAIIVAIVVVGGLVITITNPATLSFHSYVDQLVGLAVASGILGVGRGLASSPASSVNIHR